ncbi:unknown [Clostridium sp. CAG:813]|nr:unknown [Clostridium sp. CAG:813]
MEKNTQEVIFDESKTNFFKIDTPIGKLKFFVNSVIIFVAQIIVTIGMYFVGSNFYINPSLYWISFVVFIFFLYLFLVNYAKRLWDIMGNKKLAIIVAILLIMLSLTVYYSSILAFILNFVAFLILIFTSGKLIKKPE